MTIHTRRAAWLALALSGASHAALAQAAPEAVAPLVVVGATPLPGVDIDLAAAPAPVQTATSAQIQASHAVDLSAYLNRSMGGVYVNDIQNNPLQPDVNYRGYTASPLLGTPQGLSLYMDGVRLNQPFGDVVSWDLIPKIAIKSVVLAPGSNPLFGLNTLGGALSIQSKDGREAPPLAFEVSYGSYHRRQAEAEAGGALWGRLTGYIAATHFADDGWRVGSPTDSSQVFGKLGWSDAATDLALSTAYADSDLDGNGLQDQRLLARDRSSVYTRPDNTKNHSVLVNLTATHRFSDDFSFSGNLYGRTIRTRTLNGDVNEGALGESVYQPSAAEIAALNAARYTGFPLSGETVANAPFPSWRCIANALLNAEPNEKCTGLLNRSRTNQKEVGGSGQFTLISPLGDRQNRLTFGGAYVGSRAHFVQSSQFGFITADHGVTGVAGRGAFADGSQASENAFDARVDLTGRTHTWSVYATDTLTLAKDLTLTASARYDHTTVKNRDAISPGGMAGSLDGDHTFDRLNPAVGLTWAASTALMAYAGYTEGFRAPSAIELGCADPDNPCRLPNAMAGDPPLKPVTARTLEAGLRGAVGVVAWRAGVFRAVNADDILFVAGDTAGFGYFRNFGKTRRQGVELGLAAKLRSLSIDASYTFLDATYRTAETVAGDANSRNDGPAPGFEGDIEIAPGDQIPLIPRHLFKAGVRWQATQAFWLDLDMIAVSGVYARGNENNGHQPDGLYYLGAGRTDGYRVFNLGAEYRLSSRLVLFGQVDNLFDSDYETAAQLGATLFAPDGTVAVRPFAGPVIGGERPSQGVTFYAPGAPRMVRAGLRFRF